MAKIIVSCRFQKSVKDIADLIRYMATREGVEKLPDTKKYKIANQSQHDLILSVVKLFPQSKKFLEYEDFYAMPTRENANEFLDAVAERYASRPQSRRHPFRKECGCRRSCPEKARGSACLRLKDRTRTSSDQEGIRREVRMHSRDSEDSGAHPL